MGNQLEQMYNFQSNFFVINNDHLHFQCIIMKTLFSDIFSYQKIISMFFLGTNKLTNGVSMLAYPWAQD